MINRSQNEIIKNWPILWEKPIVSVRCTTYNHEKYIAQALDSFLMQDTNFPFEIVVHDDASVDRTADIIREYEAKYPKIIKPIYETENQYSKRNGSLRRIVNNACQGKYIAFCEGDDYWCDSHKLQMQYEAMEAHPECSLCTHIVQAVSENGIYKKDLYPQKGLFTSSIIEQDIFAQKIIAENKYPFQTCSYFIRKKLLQQNNDFFYFPGNGDEKILRLSLKEGKIYFIPSVKSCYRNHCENSWAYQNYSNPNNHIRVLKNTNELNHSFDEYTQFKFHNFVEIGEKKINLSIARIKINQLIQNRQFQEVFEPHNKEIAKGFISPYKLWVYYIFSKSPHFIIKILYSLWTHIRPIIQRLTNKT